MLVKYERYDSFQVAIFDCLFYELSWENSSGFRNQKENACLPRNILLILSMSKS